MPLKRFSISFEKMASTTHIMYKYYIFTNIHGEIGIKVDTCYSKVHAHKFFYLEEKQTWRF